MKLLKKLFNKFCGAKKLKLPLHLEQARKALQQKKLPVLRKG